MARKRMISPEIWESSSFSKLSDFAKLVFIGLISNADDSGKGKANPSYIRSRLFPNDEDRRVTDIKKALSEIALSMSITFYEVEGDSFYLLTNWSRWQKIDRPTPSKIPNPPQSEDIVGERGRTTQNQLAEKDSTSTRRVFDEASSLNRIEKNRIPPFIPPKGGEGDEEARERFFTAYPKLKGLAKYKGINYTALYRQFEKSEFLRTRFSVNWVFENYADIIAGVHDDKPNGEEYMRAREAWYTSRRDAAQALAERNRKRAEQSAAFCEAERACKSAEISIAKAEAQGAANEAADAVKAREDAARVLKRELKNIGLTEKDLLPQWHCKKCSDTGFLPDGRACDCYEEKERC